MADSSKNMPQKPRNWLVEWFKNLSNTKKNWGKVKSSPYASLTFALKVRQVIIGLLIPYLLWFTYTMIRDYHANGMMLTIGRLFMGGIMAYVCWKIYSTIPAAKKQIEYYKKYPHLINYCPTDTRQTVDDIMKKIEENKSKPKEAEDKDVRNNKETKSSSTS